MHSWVLYNIDLNNDNFNSKGKTGQHDDMMGLTTKRCVFWWGWWGPACNGLLMFCFTLWLCSVPNSNLHSHWRWRSERILQLLAWNNWFLGCICSSCIVVYMSSTQFCMPINTHSAQWLFAILLAAALF